MSTEAIGSVADWISAFGTIGAGIVAWLALKYAKNAYEAQTAQLEIQQKELKEDMVTRMRLRQVQGPIWKVTTFGEGEFILGLEIETGAVFRSNLVLNKGAWIDHKFNSDTFKKEITAGCRCIAIHNHRKTVALTIVKAKCLDKDAEGFFFARVSKVKRHHINFDWEPGQMWVAIFPEAYFKDAPQKVKILVDFETQDRIYDRYLMELDLKEAKIRQLNPLPLFE